MEPEKRPTTGEKTTRNKVDQYATKLSSGLFWLNERAWPLTVGILSVAGLYLYQYIQVEKVP